MSKTQLIKLTIALGGGALVALAGLGGSYIVPLDNEAIQYATRPTDDPITRLQARIQSGDVKLRFDDEHGYLSSVLEALDVPVQSQVLVFSKTSFQAPRISPRMPRALYFNDHVSVGFVRGGDVLEVASVDAEAGCRVLYARSGARRHAEVRKARHLPAVPSVGIDARSAGIIRHVGLSRAIRHASISERHNGDQSNAADLPAMGRMVRHGDSRQADASRKCRRPRQEQARGT